MAEGLVTDLIKQLVSVVAREAEQEIRLVVGVDKEVEKLKANLRTVRAVLNDAEKKQITDETVKVWLERLNNVCYGMEDVVDEWNTELIKSTIHKEEENANNAPVMKKKQVCSFIPSSSCCFGQVDKLARRHDIAHKIKELNGILDGITKERVSYGFELTNYPAFKVVDNSKQTTSHVDVSNILGRDKVKNNLVSILLGKGTEKEKHPHVISLVGMGGMGKTTLAQFAYNDQEVKAHFEIMAWVCVLDPFDQCKVAKEILESIEGKPTNLTTLESLLKRISDKVGGKKFFLVFDDVWTEDFAKWEPFRDALKNCGSQSSKVLVTTRNYKVARMMESANMIELDELSEEDCWSMFSKIAFLDKDPQQCEQLKDFGREISKKCKGLPLAAKTLGSLMRFKKSREEWKNVLNSNLWELEGVERGLFAPLLLSYYDLLSPLKQCFSYCAVFPKGHIFDVDELVHMWIAHGFVESKGNMEVEIMAREYFENLVIRSFFQGFGGTTYKMHDIVYEFTQSISNTRHLGLLEASQFPQSIDNAKNLRTVIFFNQSGDNMSNLFQNFRHLRVLTLNLEMELLDTVENLIHLRYLDLSCSNEVFSRDRCVLPETICNLCNLQFLRIEYEYSNRWLAILPLGIGKLINLRHLIGDKIVTPRGIGRLISLRTLNCVNISDEDSKGCKLEELKNLNHLQGSFKIKGLGNVVDVGEAENAQLSNKIHLRDLSLFFNKEDAPIGRNFDPHKKTIGRNFCDFSRSFKKGDVPIGRIESNVLVLNALGPPQDLEKLCISDYQGTTMSPNWLTSLTNLKRLDLYYAPRLMSLPPLGKIPCLKSLIIESALSLKKVGVEFLGIESENKKEDIIIFPNLKFLSFSFLYEWEEWIGGTRGGKEDEDCITIMPRLQKLIIHDCGKLKSLPDFLRTTPLKELEISNCPIIKERCQRETGEDWHNISHIPITKLTDGESDNDSDGVYASASDFIRKFKSELYISQLH